MSRHGIVGQLKTSKLIENFWKWPMNLCSESASDVVCHSLLACTRKPSVVHLECGCTLVTNTPCACSCWVAVGSGRSPPQQAQGKGVYLVGWIGSMQEVWVGVQDLWQKRAGRGGLCSTDGEFLSPTLSLSLSLFPFTMTLLCWLSPSRFGSRQTVSLQHQWSSSVAAKDTGLYQAAFDSGQHWDSNRADVLQSG